MGHVLVLLLLTASADAGGSPAQGQPPDLGKTSPSEVSAEVSDLLKAAEKGDTKALAKLGDAYWRGHGSSHDYGVQQNPAEAVRWYRKAAARGDPAGEFGLALAYDYESGVSKNLAQAAYWYKKSLQHGAVDWRRDMAQSRLGVLYKDGEGVPQDHAESVRWFKKGAARGDCENQYQVAVAYYEGKGVPRDYGEAYLWANLAAARVGDTVKGFPFADSLAQDLERKYVRLREAAAEQLRPAQLSAMQKRCRQWMDTFEKRKAEKRGKVSNEEGTARQGRFPP